jgi:hypothetical protein
MPVTAILAESAGLRRNEGDKGRRHPVSLCSINYLFIEMTESCSAPLAAG